ncbi:fused acetyl-CoA:acetoacetyl-CoA transferase: alpha subunit/beta subunit [Shigella sonnei]|nr:fused acetyl-CoA:acetoacetyl-CoA transferase: alpha subunit/beta subunit [Shigella sonnei]
MNYIPDEATLCVLGAGGGILEATTLITYLYYKAIAPDIAFIRAVMTPTY